MFANIVLRSYYKYVDDCKNRGYIVLMSYYIVKNEEKKSAFIAFFRVFHPHTRKRLDENLVKEMTDMNAFLLYSVWPFSPDKASNHATM